MAHTVITVFRVPSLDCGGAEGMVTRKVDQEEDVGGATKKR